MREKPVFSVMEERVEYDVEETIGALKELESMLELFKSRHGEQRVVFSVSVEVYVVPRISPINVPKGLDGG